MSKIFGQGDANRSAPYVYVAAFLCMAIPFALFACGSNVSSKPSNLIFSNTAPIKVGDTIFYYLPAGVIKIDGVPDSKGGWTVSVGTDVHADPSNRYELTLNQRYPFFDHNAILTADEKGLLKTANTVSTDRTVDALGALVTAAGQVLQFAAAAGLRGAPEAPTPKPFHITLDPFVRDSRSRKISGFSISVNPPPHMELAAHEEEASLGEHGYAGIMTRLAIPFTVTVTPPDGGDSAETTVLLPDRRQRYLLSMPRAPFVQSETTVDFVNGCLVTRNMKRPSIANAILGIPKTILTALVPIPGQVQAAESTRIQNQINLLKETAQLQQLENASPTPVNP